MGNAKNKELGKQNSLDWKPLLSLIERSSNIIVATHEFPDADGIGAALALIDLLKNLNKKVRFVCDLPLPEKFSFLDTHGHAEVYREGNYNGSDALILIDTHTKARIGQAREIFDMHYPDRVGVVDHHVIHDNVERIGVIDPACCSSSALVWRLFKKLDIPISVHAAKGIYAGVLWDTGRFAHSSTTVESYEIAKECIRIGVCATKMYTQLYQHVSYEQFIVYAHAIERVETYCNHRIILQQILREDYEWMGEKSTEIQQMDFDSIHEFNKLIHEVEVVVLLSEQLDGTVRISLRSKTDLDVSKVVEPLGGGGHRKAAGAHWIGEISEAKTNVLDLLFPLMEL